MTSSNTIKAILTGAGAFAVMAGNPLVAGDYGKAVIDDKMPIESTHWCDFFKKNTLYEGDGFIKKVKFKGRYHGQWVSQQEDLNDTLNNGYHEYQHRRFRLGMEIEMAHDLTLVLSNNISDGSGGSGNHGLTNGTFFDDWDELNLAWEPNDDFYVIVGKQKQKFTRENTTSSNSILTIERSPIVSQVVSDKPWGVAVGFKAFGLDHEVGGYVVGGDLNSNGERWNYAEFDSNASFNYRTNFAVSEETKLFFEYAYTDNNDGAGGHFGDSNLGSAFEHVAVLGSESKWGQLGLITDFIYAANGLSQSSRQNPTIPGGFDTYGVVIMPYYDITDKLQFVTKYSYMDQGREQRTARFDRRYAVEDYHTFYAGLNYYICKHNLKVMGGYEYSTGQIFGTTTDIDTGTWMLAIRTSW